MVKLNMKPRYQRTPTIYCRISLQFMIITRVAEASLHQTENIFNMYKRLSDMGLLITVNYSRQIDNIMEYYLHNFQSDIVPSYF